MYYSGRNSLSRLLAIFNLLSRVQLASYDVITRHESALIKVSPIRYGIYMYGMYGM